MALKGETHVVVDVAQAFADIVQEEFASRPRPDDFVIALGGGSTARPCNAALLQTNIDWSKVTLIWGDERMVPQDHEDSNYRIAKETLIDKIGENNFKAIHWMDRDRGPEAYGEIVRNLLPIDVMHMGLGEDGHVLSLFPGSPTLETAPNELCVAAGDELHKHPRMTLTYSAVEHTRVAIFVLAGAGKQKILHQMAEGADYPASRVNPQRLIYLADRAAAGQA